MSDRPIKLLLIDQDLIFCAGLRVVVEQFPDLEVVGDAQTGATALQLLAESANATASPTGIVDLVVLELGLDRSGPSQRKLGLELCRQLKNQYPNLPLLLLSSLEEPALLAAARQAGVDGYCPKGCAVSELVAAMRQVAAGRSYWVESSDAPGSLATLRNHLRWSGLRQIDATLAEVTAQLQVPGLPLLDQAILAGQRRELLAARWLVNRLLVPTKRLNNSSSNSVLKDHRLQTRQSFVPAGQAQDDPAPTSGSGSQLSLGIQSTLFEATLAKLQFSLQNLTSVPLEIDIFREQKKTGIACYHPAKN